MKKNLSALLALLLCLSAACAEPILPAETPAATEIPAETPEPTAAPAPEITPEPTAEASLEPSAEPTAEPTPGPSAEPTPEATMAPEATPAPEGCLLDADGNALRHGTLAELLEEPGPLRLLVSTPHAVKLEAFPLMRLQEIELLADEAAFAVPVRVALSLLEDLSTEITPAEIAAFDANSVADLYIYLVEILPEPTATPEPAPGALRVTPENWVQGAWSCVQPTFHLSGIGEADVYCDYAAIILDERIVILSGDSYLPEEEGIFTLRFSILDEMGDFTQRSERYEVMLDFTPPSLNAYASMEKDYTLCLSFGDNMSGAVAYSMDAGASWIPLDGIAELEYSAGKKQTIAPGTIWLRDAAGNVSMNEAEILLDKLPSMGGGGSGVQKPDHSAGDGDTAQYNAYELNLPDGEVETRSLGGEELALSLSAQEESACFTASLLAWKRADEAQAENDTLLLRAEELPVDEDGKQPVYLWKINGAVLRKLYNSGLRYLLLEAGGARLSLPTEGFTAGTEYARLKMQGVSTAEFDYEIRMRPLMEGEMADKPVYSCSEACIPELLARVGGVEYPLLAKEASPEMYPLNVYCGPLDLADYPYGAYPGFESDEAKEA